MKYTYYYSYKKYIFTILADDTAILQLKLKRVDNSDAQNKMTPLIKKAVKQLDEYFNGVRKNFELPIKPAGTAFQKKVWANLQKIQYGKTISYKELALMSGNINASRAVGLANNKNPIAIIIPCHRVIGSDGSLTGYAGGLELKQDLLNLEKKAYENN